MCAQALSKQRLCSHNIGTWVINWFWTLDHLQKKQYDCLKDKQKHDKNIGRSARLHYCHSDSKVCGVLLYVKDSLHPTECHTKMQYGEHVWCRIGKLVSNRRSLQICQYSDCWRWQCHHFKESIERSIPLTCFGIQLFYDWLLNAHYLLLCH